MVGEFFIRSGEPPLLNLIELATPLTNKLYLFIGDYPNSIPGVEVIKIKTTQRRLVVSRVLQQVLTHLRILLLMIKLRQEIDILIYIFGTAYPLPLIFAQALGVKCYIILATEGSDVWAQAVEASATRQRFGELTRLRIQGACERISIFFSDKLIVYSSCIIDQMNLRRYVEKIAIYPKYVSDYDLFDVRTNVEERQDLVGYVGRLSEEKGVLNLIQAIPLVVSELPQLRFTLIGEGRLRTEIEKMVDRNGLAEHTDLVTWVSHDDLPVWLNKFKLIVVPSYTETGPNIMFESMACGTPVLATRVGVVSDVIEEGETGFILKSNSPSCIARSIIRVISSPDLDRIAKNAYTCVRERYTRARTSEAWREILLNERLG